MSDLAKVLVASASGWVINRIFTYLENLRYHAKHADLLEEQNKVLREIKSQLEVPKG